MIDAIPVAHSQLSPPQLAGLTDAQRQRLLGVTCIGGPAESWHGELPVQNVAAPLLGRSAGALNEVWYSAESCRSGESAGIRFRVDDNVLYGVLDVAEADFRANALPLQSAAEDAYRRIFALLDREGYPHLWRAWNYLADINMERDGLERYRQFNIGRHDAFLASGRLARGSVPAACALGTARGPLTIAFMAGRTAPTPIENPRQISAYDYPAAYGPRSPTFSRAAFARLPGQELLFISGTASIVGHRTMHIGDIDGQTHETLANIVALLESANGRSLTTPYTLSELRLRAYIRHADDYPRVQAILEEALGTDASVIYVQADICRGDLLVEIEAMASHMMGSCNVPIKGLLSAAALAALLPAVAAAGEERPLWEVGIGVAALSFPAYRGADKQHDFLMPVPYLVYHGDFFKADRHGIRGDLFDTDRVDLTLSFSASPPTKSDDVAARAGMPNLKPTVEFGPELDFTLWRTENRARFVKLRMPLRAAFTVQGTPQDIGWIFSPNLNMDIGDLPGMPDWNLGMVAGPIWATRKQHEYFYGVAPQYATASRPAYAASGGYSGSQFIVALSKRFAKTWVGAFIRYDTLSGAAFEDSPLTAKRNFAAAGVGVSWVLDESKTRVWVDD